MTDAELTREEWRTTELVKRLVATGSLRPLIEALRNDETEPEGARDALRMLAEYDLDRLVQLALDTLIEEDLADPGLADRSRRHTEP